MCQASRRVATSTVRGMQAKVKEKLGINISYGLTLILKPFYVVKPTDKEKAMCLCKFCLNIRLQFNALMAHSKKVDGPVYDSITKFFMDNCQCPKSENGYWQLQCCTGSCKKCENDSDVDIPNLDDKDLVTYYQFEVTKTEYLSKKTGTMKESTRTERVDKSKPVVEIYSSIMSMKDKYLQHRFQVENDRYHWKKVIDSQQDFGTLFHMDYSENVSGTPKFEPQDAHFSKSHFSLHCTVAHVDGKSHNYIYHLTDDLNHDWLFTSEVLNDIVVLYPDCTMYRFKFDNCASQFKSLNVFPVFLQLAKKLNKPVIVYYGVKGHGKGLVDAMSGFGVKTPLRRAIVTSDVFFDSAEKVWKYFSESVDQTSNKIYRLVKDLERGEHQQMEISGCRKLHMFSYFPNGEIQLKENICSCDQCLKGNFRLCDTEPGRIFRKSSLPYFDDNES